jgi:co-chaperonin GroES (HSP10)
MKVLENKVLVKILAEQDENMKNGIILAGDKKPKTLKGKVKHLGPVAVKNNYMALEDTVLIPFYGGTDMEIEKTTYRIITDDAVLAILGE